MNGIKVNLDSAMINLVKGQFNALITELESKGQVKLNINFGNSISMAGTQVGTLKEQINGIMSSGDLSKGFKVQMDSTVVTAKEDIAKIKGSFQEIEDQYKKLGNYKITPTNYDENGNLAKFTVQLEQVEGLIDKISYKANASTSLANGSLQSLSYGSTGIVETDKTAEIAKKNLKDEEDLINSIANAREKSNLAQMESEKKLGETQAKYSNQAIENEAKLSNAESQRIAKMGESQGSLSTGFFEQSDKEIMKYGQSLLDSGEKMKSFQRITDDSNNSTVKMTSTMKGSSGQTQIMTRTFDENTSAVYKNEGAIKSGVSGLENMIGKMKNAASSVISFSLITGGLYASLSKLKEAFELINTLNKTETNIKMITGMDDSSVQQLTTDYSKLATTLHETTSEIMTASEEFLRAGNNQKDTASLLESSTVMSKIAGQSQKDSADSLISIMNAYKLSAGDMIGVVDKMVAVD